jgi:predicted phage terminase large subunit-like protein
MEIKPQEGPQSEFLASKADIAIYGGSAGGGKTFGMLIDPLRHIQSCPNGGAVYFRRTTTNITNEGGLWDNAVELYSKVGAKSREGNKLDITFPHPTKPKGKGFKITFAHLQHEKDKFGYQGAQIPILYFDELTHFTRTQFFYLQSRNRSVCGITPYTRATCNPEKNSWVRDFIDWWIDEDGWAIPERSGVLRWLIVYEDKDHWFDTREEAVQAFAHLKMQPISVTFILSRLKDNKILNEKDPSYRAKLMSMNKVDRMKLLGDEEKGGNWNIVPSAGMYFKKHYFEELDTLPVFTEVVRFWDRAATEWKEGDSGDPDYTVGFKMGKTRSGEFYILDIIRERLSAGKVDQLILNTAKQDGQGVVVGIFQDPGGAGKNEAEAMVKMLAGFQVYVDKVTKDKITLAKTFSSQSEHGNVKMYAFCRKKEDFYAEAENFPDDNHDDIIDGGSGAFNYLNRDNIGAFTADYIQESRDESAPRYADTW